MTRLKSEYPLYLANRPEASGVHLEVHDKFTGSIATRVHQADTTIVERAIAAAVAASDPMARMAPYQREAVLLHCVRRSPHAKQSDCMAGFSA